MTGISNAAAGGLYSFKSWYADRLAPMRRFLVDTDVPPAAIRSVTCWNRWSSAAPGSRTRTGDFHRGAARLAGAAGAPLVPAGICGTRALLPPGGPSPPHCATVTVRFGPPLYAAPPGGGRALDVGEATAETRARVVTLAGSCSRVPVETGGQEGVAWPPELNWPRFRRAAHGEHGE